MDKIHMYNCLVKLDTNQKTTQNFLDGIVFHFMNIEFFYTFVKAISKKFDSIIVEPSYSYEGGCHKQLIFKIDGKNNEAISKALNKQLNNIKNRHGEATCSFEYDKKRDVIILNIHNIELGKGEIRSVIKNQYS